LEIDVAVIKTNIESLKDDTKSVKNLLKWFIVLSLTILALVSANIWSSSGSRKVQELHNKNMQEILIHNSTVIGDMAKQGIEHGWYKPSKEAYRNAK